MDNEDLLFALSAVRAVLSVRSGTEDIDIECLVPFSCLGVGSEELSYGDGMVVRRLNACDKDPCLAFLATTRLREALPSSQDPLGARPSWTLSSHQFCYWFKVVWPAHLDHRPAPNAGILTRPARVAGEIRGTGSPLVQSTLSKLVLGVRHRKRSAPEMDGVLATRDVTVKDPRANGYYTGLVTFDMSSDTLCVQQVEPRWTVTKRNAVSLISKGGETGVQLDAALLGLLCSQQQNGISCAFLEELQRCCRRQLLADRLHAVPWSRHFLACLQRITRSEVLVGARAVIWNPHFIQFSSPDQSDASLGSFDLTQLSDCPHSCLMLLDE
jgi:hypothetical protein